MLERFGVMQTVRDKEAGKQLAWIEDGKVFNAETKELIAVVRNGKVFRPNGVFVCHLASLGETGEIPEAFKKLFEEE
jgi:hypothetical protein